MIWIHGPLLPILEVEAMEESTLTENQPVPQRFYALEQLTDQAQTIRLIADALQVYREQVAQQLDAGDKAQA